MTASDGPAGPYAQVVVGTDGSTTARLAVAHAAELAALCGARLTVVSAYTRDEEVPAELRVGEEDWTATGAAAANDHVIDAQELARGFGVQHVGARTGAGDPAEVVLEVAEDVGADVVVVGSRGMATPSRFLLGSVPNRVSHHARCDVVIVRTSD